MVPPPASTMLANPRPPPLKIFSYLLVYRECIHPYTHPPIIFLRAEAQPDLTSSLPTCSGNTRLRLAIHINQTQETKLNLDFPFARLNFSAYPRQHSPCLWLPSPSFLLVIVRSTCLRYCTLVSLTVLPALESTPRPPIYHPSGRFDREQ